MQRRSGWEAGATISSKSDFFKPSGTGNFSHFFVFDRDFSGNCDGNMIPPPVQIETVIMGWKASAY
jgi:hypothetical protein